MPSGRLNQLYTSRDIINVYISSWYPHLRGSEPETYFTRTCLTHFAVLNRSSLGYIADVVGSAP